jgi:hypothetical protein
MERRTIIIIGTAVGIALLFGVLIAVVISRRGDVGVPGPGTTPGTEPGTPPSPDGTTGGPLIPPNVANSSESDTMDIGLVENTILTPQGEMPDPAPPPVAPTPADADGDGLDDNSEAFYGTDPNNPDTDGDGLSDGAEINDHDTDPKTPDAAQSKAKEHPPFRP